MATLVKPSRPQADLLHVPHVTKGETRFGEATVHRSRDMGADFVTPELDLDGLVWGRSEPMPMLDVPIAEVIDFLARVGPELDFERNQHLREAHDGMTRVSALGPRVLENCYRDLQFMFRSEVLAAEAKANVGDPALLDGWVATDPIGAPLRIRAFPPRLVHILAGNSPMVAALTVVRAALSKGVHLLKLASNDLFTPTAILRTMAEIDPDHPVTRSFSAAYWQGGDEKIESIIYRAQYFDKIVVWGGEGAVRNAARYAGPGFELVAFDPKVSASLIGREAFESPDSIRQAAERAALDAGSFDQDACNCSRFQFVEADEAQADSYCEALAAALGRDSRYGNARMPSGTPDEIRDEVDVLRTMDPIYRVFGGYEGQGLVIRSDEPVDFHPNFKTVNVVTVPDLAEAVRHITVATQTVGIFPPSRKRALRDKLAAAGAQRITTLGEVNGIGSFGGGPHDAMFPIHRFMKWIVEEGEEQ
jgi:hypothetical protein